MNDYRPGLVVFSGSEREDVFELLKDRIPLRCATVKSQEELDGSDGMIFRVFCPGDDRELMTMYSGLQETEFSSGLLTAAVLSFTPGLYTGSRILLQKDEFSFRILRRMTGFAGMHGRAPTNLNSMLWETAGSLLPFFIHNMNNILARVMGNAELAEFHRNQPDKVSEKLSIALEGAEELRSFLEKLVIYFIPDDDDSEWTKGNQAALVEIGKMSSGTSVEFSYRDDAGMPSGLPFRKNLINVLIGLITASATISVNGCGSIELAAVPHGKSVEFNVKWSSSFRNSRLCTNSIDFAGNMLTRAALTASSAGISLIMGEWSNEKGAASLIVPINDGAS